MSPDLARWPHLKVPTHPVLDWVETEYTAERLTEMADAVGDRDSPTFFVKGRRDAVWNNAIESVLRALAENAAALKALNRRGNKPPVVPLNRAVHAHVLTELHGKATAAWAAVAEAWGCTAGQVKDDGTEYETKNPRKYRPDDAKRLVAAIVHAVCILRARAGEPRSTRADVLKDFDADLRHRARQLRAAK